MFRVWPRHPHVDCRCDWSQSLILEAMAKVRATPDRLTGLFSGVAPERAILAWPIESLRGWVPCLPIPKAVDPSLYRGPTDESNWVLHGRLLVGAYPADVSDAVTETTLRGILELGITTFVCLQAEYQHTGVTELAWRTGKALRPYPYDAARLLPHVRWPSPDRCHAKKPSGAINFIHFPIRDCSVANDTRVLELAHDLVERLVHGENLYVHCW
jgi:hypothetical protein